MTQPRTSKYRTSMHPAICVAMLVAVHAQAAPPGIVRLVLPEVEETGPTAWWWMMPLAIVACVGGGVLLFWGVRGVLPWRWWKEQRTHAHVHAPQGLTTRDIHSVAKACGHDTPTQAKLRDAARRMGLATPLGLYLLPHAAEPDPVAPRTPPSPSGGTTRRPR